MELRNLHQRSGVGPPRRGRAAAARDGVDRTSTPRRARRALPVLVGGLLALAVPTTAVAAPERVFELVSPAAKGGSDVSGGFFATPDGDAVAYESFAVLGDPSHALFSSTYVARRQADGWKTTSMQATVADPNPTLLDATFPAGLSADLSTAFAAGYGAFAAGDENFSQDIARVRDGVSEWVTPALTLPDANVVDSNVVGTSADGRSFVVSTTKPMLPGVPGGAAQLYRRGPDGLELVSRLPGELVSNGARLGNGRGLQGDNRAISADGRTLFFTTFPGVAQLYMRRDGQTKLISADTTGAPGTALTTYRAATEDGSRVLFSTPSRLTADAPVGGGLYRYDATTGELRLMVAGTITGVMQTSDDLSVAYVVSSAQLDPGMGTTNQPKLFRVTDAGAKYISPIAAQDSYGWTWGQGGNVGGVSADGSQLVFQTRAVLAGANLRPNRVGVYRYDATGDALTCISCHPDSTVASDGASLTGADVSYGDPGANPGRAITLDGRLAVFQTADALLPEDENDLFDVYGYDDDGLHLISGGAPEGEAHVIDVSADGRDVFFFTNASLAADDVDNGYRDVYTARIGGGFPSTEPPCTASTCDRPDAPPTVFTPQIGSTGVFAEPVDPPVRKRPTFKVERISASARRGWARSGKTRLRVRVSAPAKITVRTKLAGRTISTARSDRKSAGTSRLTLKLSKSAKARLKRTGRLRLTVTVSVRGASKAKKVTVKLIARKTTKQAGR
ncbi:MAG: PD40 domain-containing protein [Patulibacter sp.]|nr:PD40 domain-containing protein [Patulibacter sp.]